jgi:hypothetical protein
MPQSFTNFAPVGGSRKHMAGTNIADLVTLGQQQCTFACHLFRVQRACHRDSRQPCARTHAHALRELWRDRCIRQPDQQRLLPEPRRHMEGQLGLDRIGLEFVNPSSTSLLHPFLHGARAYGARAFGAPHTRGSQTFACVGLRQGWSSTYQLARERGGPWASTRSLP